MMVCSFFSRDLFEKKFFEKQKIEVYFSFPLSVFVVFEDFRWVFCSGLLLGFFAWGFF